MCWMIFSFDILGAEALRIEFDRKCSTERRHDPLVLMDANEKVICTRSGREWPDWSTEVRISGTVLVTTEDLQCTTQINLGGS